MSLDRTKKFATVHGDQEGRHFFQDGKYFDAAGEEIVEKVAAEEEETTGEIPQPYDWDMLAAERAAIPLSNSDTWGHFEQMLDWPSTAQARDKQPNLQFGTKVKQGAKK